MKPKPKGLYEGSVPKLHYTFTLLTDKDKKYETACGLMLVAHDGFRMRVTNVRAKSNCKGCQKKLKQLEAKMYGN